jgi:hypothetical protein
MAGFYEHKRVAVRFAHSSYPAHRPTFCGEIHASSNTEYLDLHSARHKRRENVAGPMGDQSIRPADESVERYRQELLQEGLVTCGCSCIIPSGVEATPSEFWQKRKIPPPSSLDGRVGRRSPSEARNTLASSKPNAKSVKAVALPSPRNPPEKRIEKQRALVVVFTHDRIVSNHPASTKRLTRACGRFDLGLKSGEFGASDCRR